MKEEKGILFIGQPVEVKTLRTGGYKVVFEVPDTDGGEKMQVQPMQELLGIMLKNCQLAVVLLKEN